jgi:hypothetical protein
MAISGYMGDACSEADPYVSELASWVASGYAFIVVTGAYFWLKSMTMTMMMWLIGWALHGNE